LSGIAYPLLYMLSIVVRQTFNLQWWTYVNSFYDTRSAKRIIPVLATAARVGIIVAGQTIPFLNAVISPNRNIILLWLGALLLVALAAWLAPRLFRGNKGASTTLNSKRTSFTQNLRAGYRYVSQSPFLRWMALSTLFMMLLFALLEYYTSYIFVQSGDFGSGGELSSFLGRMSSWASLILLPFQLFLLSRLVGRMGLGNANLIFPTGTLAICGALVGWPQVSTSALGYLDRKVFRSVFRNPPDNLLYNAVPLRVKGRARAFIGGLIAPIGALAGGGLLLLLPLVSVEWFLPALIGASTVAYIISAFVVRRRYSQALITMLEQEDFSFLLSSASALAVTDSTTLNWLTKKLEQSASADFTIFMASLISEVGGSKAIPILGRVARAGDTRVRSTVIDILAASGVRGEAVLQVYTEFLDDPDGRVRRSAIAGLEQATGSASEWFLNHALDMLPDPDVDVRAQVIPPLARSGDFFYLASAIQSLNQLVEDEDPDLRARGVYVLGQVGNARFIRNLIRYLDDPDDRVRTEAAAAIETLSRDQVPDRIASLTVEHLSGLVDDPVEQVRRAAVTILQRIDLQEAHQALVHFLADP
ncbi:MAG: Npt1/Npt2 family nucleotide transporter, partial [Chloroflexota bacterium]|nr:Npt1/Npt2 family nucleotide transporter [Chloroflexota bacterium]